jgi:serine/threonine protein kinase
MSSPTQSWPRDALPNGTVLNGYRIDRVLGRGGFGITYQAVDGIDQVFALKECFPRQFCARDGEAVAAGDEGEAGPFADCLGRFIQEARALRQLSALGTASGGIVKVVTYFEANGTAYIVMEHVGGTSLDAVIRAAPQGLPEDRLRPILLNLAQAVACVHEAGLLHRDIKPGNILVREDGRPVLIDFGAARGARHGMTVTYTQIYSESYAPIEQFAGAKQGPYSDIYALGATLYRAIGGKSVDSFTRHQAILRGKPDPLAPAVEFGAGRYSRDLLRTIDCALIVAPEDRPQSIADLLRLLDADEAALAETKLAPPSSGTARPGDAAAGPAGRPDAMAPGPTGSPGPVPISPGLLSLAFWAVLLLARAGKWLFDELTVLVNKAVHKAQAEIGQGALEEAAQDYASALALLRQTAVKVFDQKPGEAGPAPADQTARRPAASAEPPRQT